MEKIHYDLSRFEVQNKVLHEFQAIGIEMQEFFPKKEWKLIWSLFWKHDPKKVEIAFKECKKRGINSVRYLMGILKNLH